MHHIIFGNKSSRNLKFIMQEAELERSLKTKFLGVIKHHKLSWKTHIHTAIKFQKTWE